jgi:alanine or glycine:cation symporter, AGCS family
MTIDTAINEAFRPIAEMASNVILYAMPLTDDPDGPKVRLIVIWLAAAALFFSFYLRFVSIRYFMHGLHLITGRHKEVGHENAPGEISNFQAIATCLSGTVGLGNIAGVAIAISMGGPGAALWMGLMGLFGMCSKFAEAALGCKYRQPADERFSSNYVAGPMYYIKVAFERHGMKSIGAILAALFAVFTIGATLGGGNMFQANQVYMQVVHVTGGDISFWADKGWLFGIIMAALVGVVIIGGLQSIARVSSLIVPLMAIVYLLAGSIVLIANYQMIPQGIVTIFTNALSPQAGLAGLLGSLIAGVQRAAFSNEAGLGTAAFTHSYAKTHQPVTQGFVAMIGPFVDTVVICMMTALVIVISGVYADAGALSGTFQGVTLTSQAFATVLPWFPIVLTFTVFLFAYSTQITWFYYGLLGCTYLFGQKWIVEWAFKIVFLLAVIVGCSASLDSVIDFTDATFFALAIPNILALYILAPELKRDVDAYLKKLNSERNKKS